MFKSIQKFTVVFEKLPNVFVAASYPIISPSNMQDFTDDWKHSWMNGVIFPSYRLDPKVLVYSLPLKMTIKKLISCEND